MWVGGVGRGQSCQAFVHVGFFNKHYEKQSRILSRVKTGLELRCLKLTQHCNSTRSVISRKTSLALKWCEQE